MFKRMSVVFCGLAVIMMTAGAASAQTATQDAKAKTKSAAKSVGTVMTDAEITAAVKTKFLADTKVKGLNINVDTDKGVVTLTGTAHSAAEKAEAVRLARTTKGVKKVVSSGLTVEAKKTAENDTKTAVKEDTKSAAKKTENAAKKAGNATEDAAKKTGNAIEKGAKKTGEETKKVAGKVGEEITDDSITTAVKTKLLADSKVGGLKINVDTDKHVVTLTGNVKSAAERDEALRLAKTTTGVKSVVNNLKIVP
jgi:hyperosmotically inducible periplasmic protein